jgi:hypothetical protein
MIWSMNVEKVSSENEMFTKDILRREKEKENIFKEKNFIKSFFDKIIIQMNKKDIKYLLHRSIYDKTINLITVTQEKFSSTIEKVKYIGIIPENNKLNFNIKEPSINETNLKRVSANGIY